MERRRRREREAVAKQAFIALVLARSHDRARTRCRSQAVVHRIDKRRKQALIGGGLDRVDAQHKRVRFPVVLAQSQSHPLSCAL